MQHPVRRRGCESRREHGISRGESVDRGDVCGGRARNVEGSVERVGRHGAAGGRSGKQRGAGTDAAGDSTRRKRIGQRVQLCGGHGERGGKARSRRCAGGGIHKLVGGCKCIVEADRIRATGANISAARHKRGQRPYRCGSRDFIDDEGTARVMLPQGPSAVISQRAELGAEAEAGWPPFESR